MTEVQPISMHSLIRAKSLQWSRCKAIGTLARRPALRRETRGLAEPVSSHTHDIIAELPQKITVLAEVWIITGEFVSSAALTTALVEL